MITDCIFEASVVVKIRIREVNRRKRVVGCRKKRRWPVKKWKKVIFWDESQGQGGFGITQQNMWKYLFLLWPVIVRNIITIIFKTTIFPVRHIHRGKQHQNHGQVGTEPGCGTVVAL